MIDFDWSRTDISAQDILDGLDSLTLSHHSIIAADLTSDWTTGQTYLAWAEANLQQGIDHGWDAALIYSKRAVCRHIDAMIVNNHLGCFIGRTYPEKLKALERLGLNAPDILHDLIIDPRNHIEHRYKSASQQEARHAVQLAKLFLPPEYPFGGESAFVSYAWSANHRVDLGPDVDKFEFTFKPHHSPQLFVDTCDPDEHVAMILRPATQEMFRCLLKDFSIDQALALAKKLSEQLAKSPFISTYKAPLMARLKEELKL